MSSKIPPTDDETARGWWRTEIIDIAPGEIRIRGYAIEQLIGNISFPSMIWLMLRGELPTPAQASLLEAVLVAAVDHGPQAPSIATARMAITCGIGLNNAIASGVNALGDVHGGAGAQCMELLAHLHAMIARGDGSEPFELSIASEIRRWQNEHGKFLPGYGHRFHPVDPRAVRLTELLEEAKKDGAIGGDFLKLGRAVETHLGLGRRAPIPMNIDGITAVVLLELGFPPPLGRGVFILSRAVGICAHAWEEMQEGRRIKGPLPPALGFLYTGHPPRSISGTRKNAE